MHFSITQQRTAFLTKACLGAVRPSRKHLDAARLTVTTDPQGTRHLILDRENEAPLLVNPLLLGFNRVKSNAGQQAEVHQPISHSARASSEELSWQYSLRVVKYQGEWLLLGIQNDNPAAAKLLIGRSREEQEHLEDCFITLEPGWRLVHQTYNDEQLQQLYLVQDDSLADLTTSYGATSSEADDPSKPSHSSAAQPSVLSRNPHLNSQPLNSQPLNSRHLRAA